MMFRRDLGQLPPSTEKVGGRSGIRELLLMPLGYILLIAIQHRSMVADLAAHFSNSRDYYLNHWTLWWVNQALDGGRSLYDCSVVFYPAGASLAYHITSFANTIPAQLLYGLVGQAATHNLVFLANAALGGIAAYLLLRHVSGSRVGAFLGGILFTCSPYHASMIAQLNNTAFHWMPLFLLSVILVYERGSWVHVALAGVWFALCGYTDWYQPVSAVFLAGIFLIYALTRDRRWQDAALWARLFAAAAVAALLLVPGIVPLLQGLSEQAEDVKETVRNVGETQLLGIRPGNGPFFHTWPVVFGYTTFALLLLGATRWRTPQAKVWWILSILLFLLLLGPRLVVANHLFEAVPLPMALFAKIPMLSFFRVPHRFLLPLSLAVAGLLAVVVAQGQNRMSGSRRKILLLAAPAILFLEFLPTQRAGFVPVPAPIYAEMEQDSREYAVLELPLVFSEGYYMWLQTQHGKPLVGGYLAHTPPRSFARFQGRLWRALLPVGLEFDLVHHPLPLALDVDALSDTEVEQFRKEMASCDIGVVVLHHGVDGGEPDGRVLPARTSAGRLASALLPYSLNRYANDAEGWARYVRFRIASDRAARSTQARELILRMFGPPDRTQWRGGVEANGPQTEVWDLRAELPPAE